MNATIRDIAQRTGVTHRTVSNVLSGQGKGVRADARSRAKRILQVADELGYRPNAYAKAIRRGRFNAVGLLASVTRNRSNFPALLWEGIDAALTDHDMHLVLTRLPDEQLTDEAYVPKVLRELSVDGLLINYTHGIPSRMIELIEQHTIPSIWLNTKRTHDCVYPDDVAAGRAAADHLLQRGHRRIAFMTGVSRTHYSMEDRIAGAAGAMRTAGEEMAILSPSQQTWQAPQRLAEFDQYLREQHPSAIITYGAMDALTVLRVADRAGLDVPRDLSIISIGPHGDNSAGIVISTVMVDEAGVGRSAVEVLQRKIAQPDKTLAPVVVKPHELIGGQTCAAPKDVSN